jgi:hypothetical protein
MAENLTPGIKWFSRLLPNLDTNKGLTVKQKKAKAQKDCKDILALQSGGKFVIARDGFKWVDPTKKEKRYKLTVWIKLKPGKDPGPSDPPIPARRNPPPSM